jgi:lipopolysaccharide transport system ATP-binding protein
MSGSAASAVIRAQGLSKRYRRGVRVDHGLRHSLERFLRSPLSLLRGRPTEEPFWALRDVSLEVREGEVLGLIGRNGAGKTTLLKILSRITRPTTGWAEIHGRVGSLLEVGTGFHPELTGRENTFLSGAILGMGKREIERKFDEIVAFAELEKFIDTQVKHYSSGMYVRLAFAVAAHLEPEILLVDEVLAVGDINFQKKCLGKMSDVARTGRTVVLVSHQLNQIRRLCQRVVWIDGGEIRQDGPPHEVVSAYESAMTSGDAGSMRVGAGSSGKGRFLRWEIVEPQGELPHTLSSLGPVTLKFVVQIQKPIVHGDHGIAIYNPENQLIWAWAVKNFALEPGEHGLFHRFATFPVRPGPYSFYVSLHDDGELVDSMNLSPEMIIATDVYQYPFDDWKSILNLPCQFEVDTLPAGIKTESGGPVSPGSQRTT